MDRSLTTMNREKRDADSKIYILDYKLVTKKQSYLIKKLTVKFPKMTDPGLNLYPHEFQTIGSCSELITRIEVSLLEELFNIHEYVQYIAQRHQVVKDETHSLFSNHDDPPYLYMLRMRFKSIF